MPALRYRLLTPLSSMRGVVSATEHEPEVSPCPPSPPYIYPRSVLQPSYCLLSPTIPCTLLFHPFAALPICPLPLPIPYFRLAHLCQRPPAPHVDTCLLAERCPGGMSRGYHIPLPSWLQWLRSSALATAFLAMLVIPPPLRTPTPGHCEPQQSPCGLFCLCPIPSQIYFCFSLTHPSPP